MLEAGTTVYFQDPKRSWIVGTVDEWDGKLGSCRPTDPKDGTTLISKLTEDQMFVAREDILTEDVDDLLSLTVLHDSTLLNCLKRRYMRNVIYTNIGAIAVALNPFNFKIPWYMDDQMPEYLNEGDIIEKNLPHSWAVAHNTYWELRNNQENQCILVSGESGAGKTEAAKIVMKYLAAISCKTGGDAQKAAGAKVGQQITLTSPPLECFGNAKTVRNDNSSRFGKFMKVKFDNEGFLVGAHITKYLLEKSRIVTASQGERCYHSLYLVIRGSDATEFNVSSDKAFKTINAGNCVNNKEFDSLAEYQEVKTNMIKVGISEREVKSMFATVAAILHLGNISYTPTGEGSFIDESTKSSMAEAIRLLQINAPNFEKELLTTTLSVAGAQITKVLNPLAAMDAKEALMKTLYDSEFQWLVDKCNDILDQPEAEGNWVGLLDIFGFEDFEVNSFEQLCINLANETLQGHYNTYIFQKDLDECRAEGIDMSCVEFPDNAPCITLVTGKGGVMALLDEECSLGKSTDMSFLAKISANCSDNPFFERKILQKSSFTVKHYAGDVSYEVTGFLDKNRDTLKDAFKVICRSSADPFVAQLLPEPQPDAKKITVGGFFKNQLKDLMDVLNSTNPHWIRCVKPHPAKKPLHWDGPSVMSQLSSSGVLGTVKIRKAGYPVRMKKKEFLGRYNILGKTVAEILETAKVTSVDAQEGSVRVFLKTDAYVLLEQGKKDALLKHAQTIQAYFAAVQEHQEIKNRIREKNQHLFKGLRGTALKILALQEAEANDRQLMQQKVLKQRQDMKAHHDGKMREMVKELRKLQVEKLRIEYEAKKKAEIELAEKMRADRQKQDLVARKKAEEYRQTEELRRLEKEASDARRRKSEKDLAEALEMKHALTQHLTGKTERLFADRQSKRDEDQRKAEAAKLRRTQMQQQDMSRIQVLCNETEMMQNRGEMMKAQSLVAKQQEREIRRLRMEGRRQDVAARLQEENLHKDRFLAMKLAVADARASFQSTKREAIQQENGTRHHLAFIDQKEREREVEIVSEHNKLLEWKARQGTKQNMSNLHKTVESFRRRTEVARSRGDKFLDTRSNVEKGRMEASSQMEGVRQSLSQVGSAVQAKSKQVPLSRASSVRCQYVRPLPNHIDPGFYERMKGRKEAVVEDYGTSGQATAPAVSLPWKL